MCFVGQDGILPARQTARGKCGDSRGLSLRIYNKILAGIPATDYA